MTDLSNLKLFTTSPHPCSYLDHQEATTLFVDPKAKLNAKLYSQLSQHGFRRSGIHVYRPLCEMCQACLPMRVSAEQFLPNRSQARCIKNNRDLIVRHLASIDTEEHYQLYQKYISLRHADGDMYPATKTQYLEFLCPVWGVTTFIEFRKQDNTLIAVAVADILGDGISAIYTFFDPEEEKRSLGVFAVLYEISWARENNLPWVYMGYLIEECAKMRYKSNYRPYQIYTKNRWIAPNSATNAN